MPLIGAISLQNARNFWGGKAGLPFFPELPDRLGLCDICGGTFVSVDHLSGGHDDPLGAKQCYNQPPPSQLLVSSNHPFQESPGRQSLQAQSPHAP
jgi:hypothetical protein